MDAALMLPVRNSIQCLAMATCETEIKNASVVWPDSVLPLASVMVPDTITGTRFSRFFKQFLDSKQSCFDI